MERVEVAMERWREFCGEFSRRHQGWRVDIGSLATRLLEHDPDAAGVAQGLARDAPLHGVSVERAGDGEMVTVSAGEPPRHLDHRVRRPVRLLLERDADGVRGLRLDGGDGRSTLVRFRVSAEPEEVDGRAPQ